MLSEVDEDDYEVLLGLIFRYDPKRGSELQHIFGRAGFKLAREVEEETKTQSEEPLQLFHFDNATAGPIEYELRKNLSILTGPTYRVYAGARAELRRRGMKKPEDIDITSEAIEAAEALGL